MDLQIPYQQSTQNKGLFNQFDVKILVQQSIVKAEKRMKGQFLEPQNHQSNPNESQIKMQTFKYTFDNISKTIYFLDHQLISSDQNAVEKSLLQLNNLFQFLFENPNHKIKNGEIINTQAGQNQIHRKVSIQSLNPLIARMLDMFLNSKIFVFKNYIADIMIRYAFVIKQIFIKEQLLQVLNKGIKGFDEYTRIISAKIIPSFIEMFEKDLVGFEYIIHKIQSFDKTNNFNVSYLVQKHSFVDCLKQMLQKSQVLSSFFIKNIKEQAFMINFHPEQKCLNINQMSILRFYEFCLHVKINTSDSLDLFKNLLKIYKNRSKNIQIMDIELLKKLKLHISKLFVKMFNQNFKVLKAIYDFQLQDSIQIDITLIQMKFGDFDEHQQKYILKDCPQKLRQLLTFQNQIIKQKSENLLQKFFMKFYTKVNQFDIQLDHHHQNIEIRKNLILKQRRLEEFLELCESQKHQKIVSLIKIWLNINGLMLSLLNNIKKQDLQVKFESTKFSIQKTASQFQDLQEELFITAEVFLLLQKSYKSNNGQFFFKQSLWANSQKLPVQNKNFLKWTYLSQKTLQNLYL